jgi:hypothetical protein
MIVLEVLFSIVLTSNNVSRQIQNKRNITYQVVSKCLYNEKRKETKGKERKLMYYFQEPNACHTGAMFDSEKKIKKVVKSCDIAFFFGLDTMTQTITWNWRYDTGNYF